MSIDSDDLARIANVHGLRRCDSESNEIFSKDRKRKQKKRRKQRQNLFEVGARSSGDIQEDKDSLSDGQLDNLLNGMSLISASQVASDETLRLGI